MRKKVKEIKLSEHSGNIQKGGSINYEKRILALGIITALLANPVHVFAADDISWPEESVKTDNAATALPVTFDDSVEIKKQVPVEITDFPDETSVSSGNGGQLDLQNAELIDRPMAHEIQTGAVQDYLTETGELKVLPVTINPGIYLQARMTQPASADIDYDLYVLDADGKILVKSDMLTKINGSSGTLPETVGYVTQGSGATLYYLAVLSAGGGSETEPFKLEFTVSNDCDPLEPNENPASALSFPVNTGGAVVSSANISSPVDNDWYTLEIPENRMYDDLILSVATPSSNTCRLEVYKDISNGKYAMSRLASSTAKTTVSVSTGTWYVRICSDKAMNDYNADDIQNYTFTVLPRLRPTEITISEYNGDEGVNHFVRYPGFKESYFRTKDWMNIKGYVLATDPSTGDQYGVSDYSVTALYTNPYWEKNNTPQLATREETGRTDSSGQYSIRLNLPTAMGGEMYNTGLTTQYFDVCGLLVSSTKNPDLNLRTTIFHYKYSLYN